MNLSDYTHITSHSFKSPLIIEKKKKYFLSALLKKKYPIQPYLVESTIAQSSKFNTARN